MKKMGFVFVCLLLVMVWVNPALTQETPKTKTGEALFNGQCASCHPNGGNVIKPKDILKGSPHLKDLQAFVAWLRKPVQPMPSFPPSKISEPGATDLYNYILEQLKGAWK